jgi:hypothetical protein
VESIFQALKSGNESERERANTEISEGLRAALSKILTVVPAGQLSLKTPFGKIEMDMETAKKQLAAGSFVIQVCNN